MAGAIQSILNFRENMTEGLQRIAGQSDDTSRQVRLLNNGVEDFRARASSGFMSVAKKAAGLTIAFAGIGAAGLTIGASVDSVKEYSTSLSQLSAATGYTGAEFDKMKASMVSVYGNNFGASWEDVGESLATVAQITGQTGKALEDSTENALVYRDVFKAEIPDSIATTDSMMKQFGITSDQAFNLLAQGSQSGLDKTGELLDGVSEFGVQFKQLGFSADEMFDTFGSGLDSGAFSLATIGDSVKEFGIRAKDGSDSTAQAFKGLNLDAKGLSATFAKGGPNAKKAFDQVVKALDKVKDPLKKNAIGTALFGSTWEDLGAKSISALANVEKGFNSTTDTMGKLNDVKYTDLDSAITGISRTLETSIVTPLADKVLPKLSELSKWVTSKTPAIKKGIDSAFKTGKELMNDFGDAMGWVKKNSDWLVPALGAVTAAVIAQQAVNGVKGLITAYKAWRTTTAGLTLVQAGLNVVLAANPLGIIAVVIGLVIGAGILLWKNWDTVKVKASELWSWLGGVWTSLKAGTVNAFNSVKEAASNLWGSISGAWTNIKTGTVDTFNGIKDSVAGTFNSMVGAVKTPINSIIGMINGLIGKINGISIEFPDWMPGDLSGKTFGLSIPTIPTFAKGTNNAPGGMSLVGEEGPELVNLKKGSSVATADKTSKILAANSSGTKIEVNIHGNVYGEADFMDKVMAKLVSVLDSNIPNVATT
ncbi:phage tail tape measure protein [Paenibacillus sp. 19GGS1-52]|uniref:phage tail tape measure protein n=1 Tax=Paenibacillus sp. 19GGS1-52 TaxID=2758563 RepID=UPI001EFBD014|nr:phage tail tape measure protein [Paenibacillus sp. 19GGS1-52]ULO09672.1 phage tail tape measure protein [Paenibacillus sp. 19GGS1-52]